MFSPLLALLLAESALAESAGPLPALEALDRGPTCATVLLRRAWRQAQASGNERALATALRARGLPSWPWPAQRPPPPAPMPDKATRDLYELPHELQNDDFVVRWGDEGGVGEQDAALLLEAADAAWIHDIDVMELPVPYGSDSYKFNVYIGDTGSGAPSAHGASGYYWTDSEGYPMVVVGLDSLDDEEWAASTVVHEFFHAVQDATGNYQGAAGDWFWEACAMWVEGEIYPENPYYAAFLMGFAFLPHLPLSFFDYPDAGELQEYHQYGAFIFPRYLSEIAADWTLVRDAWIMGNPEGDPLETLDQGLEGELLRVWGEFLAHNATWDYQDQALYLWYLDYYADWYEDLGLARTLWGAGSADWLAAGEHPPQAFGANYVQLLSPDAGELRLDFEGDALGSEGSAASWQVGLVVEGGEGPAYHPMELDEGVGQAILELTGAEHAVHLVAGSGSDLVVDGESFDYRYWLRVGDEAEPEDAEGQEQARACGCRGGPGGALGAAALGLAWLGSAARRRTGPVGPQGSGASSRTSTPSPSSKTRRSARGS